MSQERLSLAILRQIDKCSVIACNNLTYYEKLYDILSESDDRDIIGQAMAQKRSFVDAMQAILKAHHFASTVTSQIQDENSPSAERVAQSQYIVEEDLFTAAVSECLTLTLDPEFSDLLLHHLDAAQLGSEAIKSSSLKL